MIPKLLAAPAIVAAELIFFLFIRKVIDSLPAQKNNSAVEKSKTLPSPFFTESHLDNCSLPGSDVLSTLAAMTTKFAQMMKFRDNSEDDIQYDRLGAEKLLLEHPEAEAGHSKKGWSGRTTIKYAFTLASLLISVVLNVVVLSELHKVSHSYTPEGYGNEPTSFPKRLHEVVLMVE